MTLQPLFDLMNAVPRGLILPPANLFLLIAVGLALSRRWPRTGRTVAATALVAMFLLSSTGGARLLVAPLERMTAPLLAPETAGAQAIVVLSAGRLQRAPEYGGRDIPDYVGLARLRYAAHLQRRTGLPVLVSGGLGTGNTPSLADGLATALREDFGVPVKWLEARSRDTAENAAYSTALLRADGVKRILLVTDAMHMPRSRAAFERAGLEVVSAPTVFFSQQKQPLGAWLPSTEGMRRSSYALYELIGMAWYRVRSAGAG